MTVVQWSVGHEIQSDNFDTSRRPSNRICLSTQMSAVGYPHCQAESLYDD